MTPPSASHRTRTVVLKAPLSGVLVPIEEVPDPVFAQRLVGDGVAIDPISHTLCAPCDGTVVQVHTAGHAVTLASPDGLEVMMHIGLETVGLQGRGFTPRVVAGDRVDMGDPLIEFDRDLVAPRARSLLTQMVITNGERVARLEARRGTVVAGIDDAIEVSVVERRTEPGEAGLDVTSSATVVVGGVLGLHARPAVRVVAEARTVVSQVFVRLGHRVADARSVVALMALEVAPGDVVRVEARGPDAVEAVARLSAVLARPLESDGVAGITRPPGPLSARSATRRAAQVIVGTPASSGMALGHLVRLAPDEWAVADASSGRHAERARFDRARERAKAEIEALITRVRAEGGAERAALFEVHRALVDDPSLVDACHDGIDAGRSAAAAWREAFVTHAARVAALAAAWLAARSADVDDVGHRVLRHLVGRSSARDEFPAGSILVAESLPPSVVATVDRTRVVGICTVAGGALSHVALLARSLGLPAVTGVDPAVLDITEGTSAIIDGTDGCLLIEPEADELARLADARAREASRRALDLSDAGAPAVTVDGRHVSVLASVATLGEARDVAAHGADGVGLLRTEFLFVDRTVAPSDDEQCAAYSTVVSAMPGARVIVRALDVGGDKPLEYVPLAAGPNPSLGERGTRILLGRPELLRSQVRAVFRAARGARVGLMLPMVTTLEEWRAVCAVVDEERRAGGFETIALGVLVEVPAAALIAGHLAREADFLAIGTNDLAQFTLAKDRDHPKVLAEVDALHPAVLQLIARTVSAAHTHGKPVGLCGAVATDPVALPILVGLGLDDLVVPAPLVARIKADVRTLSWAGCQQATAEALGAGTAAEVRSIAARARR